MSVSMTNNCLIFHPLASQKPRLSSSTTHKYFLSNSRAYIHKRRLFIIIAYCCFPLYSILYIFTPVNRAPRAPSIRIQCPSKHHRAHIQSVSIMSSQAAQTIIAIHLIGMRHLGNIAMIAQIVNRFVVVSLFFSTCWRQLWICISNKGTYIARRECVKRTTHSNNNTCKYVKYK